MKYNCIIILGTTASGKTKLSIELAKKLNGEIVNADSQQIIKGLNIGTAKITEQEKEGIAHHLFDIIEPGQDFSVSEYRDLAMNKIKEILSRGKLPIIVGGTGFYINSLIYNYTFGDSDKNEDLRNRFEQLAKEKGNEFVFEHLKNIDPESAKVLHPNDLKRVIRAIEIFETSGNKKSSQYMTRNKELNPYIVGIQVDRDLLYDRINKRVDLMIDAGLEKEVEVLHKDGFYDKNYHLPIGYSEWNYYYNNEKTRKETIELIKQNSRHYAKRQITWFKKVENVNWFDLNKLTLDNIIENITSNM